MTTLATVNRGLQQLAKDCRIAQQALDNDDRETALDQLDGMTRDCEIVLGQIKRIEADVIESEVGGCKMTLKEQIRERLP